MEHLQKPLKSKCFTNRLMDALFFADAVYAPTPEAVMSDLKMKIGKVDPLMDFGFDEDGKQAIFVARSLNGHIIVACRGTSGVRDVLQDLKYLHTRLSFAKGAAHWGFAERAQSVPVELFCKLLSAGEDIVFTGHSLGGAVASLLSLRVLESMGGLNRHQVQCITFGSPLFASRGLADLINSMYKDSFVHVISKQDFVPRILPFLSTVQKLLYASEDHLEGLWMLRKGLECLKWLPIGGFIGALEQNIPPPIRFLLRCVMKLAAPCELSGSYAFAGHVWILDTAPEARDLLTSACADDLNMWHSQLNFALGVSFTTSMIENHAMSSYYEGVVRALSQVLLLHDKAASLDEASLAPLGESRPVLRQDQCAIDGSWALGDDSASREDTIGKSSTVPSLPGSENMLVCEDPTLACSLVNSDSKDIKNISPQPHICHKGKCHCSPNSDLQAVNRGGTLVHYHNCSCASFVGTGSNIKNAKVLLGSGQSQSARMLAGTSRAFMKHLGCCAAALRLFVPFSWERISSGALLQEVQTIYVKSKMVSSSLGENRCGRSVLVNLQTPMGPVGAWNHFSNAGAEVLDFEAEQFSSRSRGSSLHLYTTCKVKKVLIKQTSREVLRRGFRLGWIIGAIGRVARHLRALDNLCIFTFVRIVFSNLHG